MAKEMAVRASGIAWYTRETYDQCRELFEDGHKLPATFDVWLQKTTDLIDNLKGDGHVFVKAYIDPNTFPAWCRSRGLNIDSKARIRFANETAFAAYGQTH